tara:strand:+ start:1209 stop:1385 length:177 start_codon:yes stop_codon:yes gene_type:complete
MSIDIVILKTLKEKLQKAGQSEELIDKILSLLKDKDIKKINLEEKNQIIEDIIKKVKL